MTNDSRSRLLDAARTCLIAAGHGQLSTRRVSDMAGMPLSQIHYHFGGKQGMVLALLRRENEQLLERQRTMYAADVPLWRRYEQACDFLEDDLASGYVRMLQEMVAAGWADPAIGGQVTQLLRGWFELLGRVADEADARGELRGVGQATARHGVTMVGLAFLGGESLMLLDDTWRDDVLGALRAPIALLQRMERASPTP